MRYSNDPAEIRFEKKRIYNEFFVMFAFGVMVSFYMLYSNSIIGNPMLKESASKGILILQGFYIGAAFVAGWKALNRITPNVFLFLPIIGWVVYFVIKISLSSFIGVFLLPIRLFIKIRQLYLFKK